MGFFRVIQPRKPSLRVHGNNYTLPNSYMVTIVTKNRIPFLGEIIDKKVVLSDMGKIVFDFWFQLPEFFPDIRLDEFVVMPNHIHGIIEKPILTREALNAIQTKNQRIDNIQQHLSKIIRLYKSGCTRIIKKSEPDVYFEWQRNYHDEIIRDKISLERMRNYIRLNPLNWNEDENHI